MKIQVVLLFAFCGGLSLSAGGGETVEEKTPEAVCKNAVDFLRTCGLDVKNDVALGVPEKHVSSHGKPGRALYRFDIGGASRISVDGTGIVREFFGSLERSSKPVQDAKVLSERILHSVLPKDMVVAQPTISEDGAQAVHYTFQRTVKEIPVEGQRVRMAFDTQTGDLLYLQNTLEVIEGLAMELPPTVDYQQAIEQAKTTVMGDLKNERWKGMLDSEAVVLVPFARPGAGKKGIRSLIIASRNMRFDPSGDSQQNQTWSLAYDVPIEIKPNSSSRNSLKSKLFARVWIDAHTGEVIGGQ